jgi:isoaspartyl peptidase/L-asparaginase-like protein (Ntn-hydrolase superfamily)
MRIVVHGGAGSAPDDPPARQAVLDTAAAEGADAATPTAAVCRAVRHLESDPRFNAGVGSAVQSDGIVRTDAGLMTDDGTVGAACAMPGVEHAVEVARVVATETPHVLLAGVHAVDLAADFDIAVERDLWTDRTRERWADLNPPEGGPQEHIDWVRKQFGGHDTVGAVACEDGTVAAATSTGGRWCALAGRVGDVPQVGSGFYADRSGGASATGAGEDIARVTLSRRAVQHLDSGANADAAAERAVAELGERTSGEAGVIVASADGDLGAAYNSEAMQTATASE